MSAAETRIDIGSFFGYANLVRTPVFIAMAGESKRLEVGMIVRIEADVRGYTGTSFHDGDAVVIVGFRMPHTGDATDDVVFVSDGKTVESIKPHRVTTVVAHPPRQMRSAHSV
jgi:hypothetical protein